MFTLTVSSNVVVGGYHLPSTILHGLQINGIKTTAFSVYCKNSSIKWRVQLKQKKTDDELLVTLLLVFQ